MMTGVTLFPTVFREVVADARFENWEAKLLSGTAAALSAVGADTNTATTLSFGPLHIPFCLAEIEVSFCSLEHIYPLAGGFIYAKEISINTFNFQYTKMIGPRRGAR